MICRAGISYSSGDPIPLQPGDIVYGISSYNNYGIYETKIDGVAIYSDRCCVILDRDVYPIMQDCDPQEIDDVFFRTHEEAEAWKAVHLPVSPCILREADKWIYPDHFVSGPRAAQYKAKLFCLSAKVS